MRDKNYESYLESMRVMDAQRVKQETFDRITKFEAGRRDIELRYARSHAAREAEQARRYKANSHPAKPGLESQTTPEGRSPAAVSWTDDGSDAAPSVLWVAWTVVAYTVKLVFGLALMLTVLAHLF